MRFHWIKDRVKQKQFMIKWDKGRNNLADCHTKHHSGAHHKQLRPMCLYVKDKSPSCIQECIKILNERARAKSNLEKEKEKETEFKQPAANSCSGRIPIPSLALALSNNKTARTLRFNKQPIISI